MLRNCTVIALFELALLAACVGLPSASADPDDDCCGDDISTSCSGCIEGYVVDHGLLFGCQSTGGTQGCPTWNQECSFLPGPVSKYGPGCEGQPIEENAGGFAVLMVGCKPTTCD